MDYIEHLLQKHRYSRSKVEILAELYRREVIAPLTEKVFALILQNWEEADVSSED